LVCDWQLIGGMQGPPSGIFVSPAIQAELQKAKRENLAARLKINEGHLSEEMLKLSNVCRGTGPHRRSSGRLSVQINSAGLPADRDRSRLKRWPRRLAPSAAARIAKLNEEAIRIAR
jgi:hypothetical protein